MGRSNRPPRFGIAGCLVGRVGAEDTKRPAVRRLYDGSSAIRHARSLTQDGRGCHERLDAPLARRVREASRVWRVLEGPFESEARPESAESPLRACDPFTPPHSKNQLTTCNGGG
jgi:hypothetical protein